MTHTFRLALAAAALATVPLAALAQLYTPGVTQPLTAAQIARENPPNTLTGAAVDKPVVLKSQGGMSIRVVKLAEGLSHPNGLVFLPDGHTRTFGEMTSIEKHGLPPLGLGLSHRARAFTMLAKLCLVP